MKRILNTKQLEEFRQWANKNSGGYRDYLYSVGLEKFTEGGKTK